MDSTHRSNEERFTSKYQIPHELEGVGLVEFLEYDDRPVFVLDLQDDAVSADSLRPCFYNRSLRTLPDLVQLIAGEKSENQKEGGTKYDNFSFFREWAVQSSLSFESVESRPPTLHYGTFQWSSVTLRERWRVLSGTQTSLGNDVAPNNISMSSVPIPVLSLGNMIRI
jgi:hypothetical protein